MKKLARMVCLIAALALSSVSTADAWLYGTCYNSCGGSTWTAYGSCCGTQYLCSDGNYGYPTYWESEYGGSVEPCLI